MRGNWLALNNLGSLCMKTDRMDQAIADFEAALEVRPDLALTQINLGFALYLKEQFDEAIFYLQREVALKPEFAGARQNLAAVKQARAALQRGKPSGGARSRSERRPTTAKRTVSPRSVEASLSHPTIAPIAYSE